MSRSFIKMHGLGNDFVIIDGRRDGFFPDKNFCLRIADRHRGVGYDQLIVLEQPQNPTADFFMRIFNADGSDAGACGNATRCVTRLFFDETGKKKGIVETGAGILPVWQEEDGLYSVDFGPPRLTWQEIPLAGEQDTLNVSVGLPHLPPACCVNMGNPHAVFFVDDVDSIKLEQVGPQIENHALFPQRTNVEFAQILSPDSVRMRVWERGTGVTQACGSGACATLVAAVRRGLIAKEKATIKLDGGDLGITWRNEDKHVILTGPASYSYTGVLSHEIQG